MQDDEYKGWFELKIGGNCKGMGVLDFDATEMGDENYDEPKTDGMKIAWDFVYDCFNVILKNDEGDTCEYDLSAAELDNMVVRLEIVDFEKSEE